MRFRLFSLGVLACAMLTLAFQQPPKMYKADKSRVSFYSHAPMEDITAESTQLISVINQNNNNVVFKLAIKSFTFSNSLMQEHFNENYMESEKYPDATFSGKINEKIDLNKTGVYTVTTTGKFNIHGVEKEYTFPGTIIVNEGKLNLNSTFKIKLVDHKIEIPSVVNQKIAEEVEVKVNADYTIR